MPQEGEQRIFLSGPMTGRKDFNHSEFNKTAQQLRARGFVVWNPAELYEGSLKYPREKYQRNNLNELTAPSGVRGCGVSYDAVAVLPGWQQSHGSALEVAVARELGIPVIDAKTLKVVNFQGVQQVVLGVGIDK